MRPYKVGQDRLAAGSGETNHGRGNPGELFREPHRAAPQFKALTGIKRRFEKVPPAQIRQKSVIDLTSKTGTYATHAADPMYYSLYAANKWVEPLDSYLNDKSLTDDGWFKLRRHHSGLARRRQRRRQAPTACPTTARSPSRSTARISMTRRA